MAGQVFKESLLIYLSEEEKEWFWAVNNQYLKLREIRLELINKAYKRKQREKEAQSGNR